MKRKLWAIKTRVFSNRNGLFPNCVYRFEKVFLNQNVARETYQKQLKKLSVYYGTAYHTRAEFFNPHISDDGTVERYPDNGYLDIRQF